MQSSAQSSRELNGTTTEILIQNFSDRVLVLVTQIGKVGTLVRTTTIDPTMINFDIGKIQATVPATTVLPAAPSLSENNLQPLPPVPAAIELTTLLGNALSEHMQTMHSFYAAQIATMIWNAESGSWLGQRRRGVVVGIALRRSDEKDEEGERMLFFQVMSMLRDLIHK
jgi:proteasome assembly chaperone 3